MCWIVKCQNDSDLWQCVQDIILNVFSNWTRNDETINNEKFADIVQ